jgi:hypothetical protein
MQVMPLCYGTVKPESHALRRNVKHLMARGSLLDENGIDKIGEEGDAEGEASCTHPVKFLGPWNTITLAAHGLEEHLHLQITLIFARIII